MCPIGGKPLQASYTAILRGIDAWVIVDGDHNEVPITRTNRKGELVDSFKSRMDAWHCIDKLRYAARCGPIVSETSPEILSIPNARHLGSIATPQRLDGKGDDHSICVADGKPPKAFYTAI